MKNYILTALMFTMVLCAKAQEQVGIAILQDVRLATIGDQEHGYNAFTPDIIARVKMQGNQQKYGYLIVYPEFEYAQIQGEYYRYSANVGYTLNKLFLDDFEASLVGGYGFIDRYGISTSSFSLTGEIGYKVSRFFKIVVDGQLTQRSDLKWMYGDNAIRFSGFVGVEIKVF